MSITQSHRPEHYKSINIKPIAGKTGLESVATETMLNGLLRSLAQEAKKYLKRDIG